MAGGGFDDVILGGGVMRGICGWVVGEGVGWRV